MKTIKEAVESLLLKKEITQEEYDSIEKTGAFEITKESDFNSFIRGPLKNVLFATALLGGSGVATKEMIIDPIRRSVATKRSFNEMTKKVPALAEKDKDQIQDYFNVVKTFSPKAASNPLVAGALVNKMIEFGGIDHKLVQDLSAIETGLARPTVTGTAMESAAKSLSSVKGD